MSRTLFVMLALAGGLLFARPAAAYDRAPGEIVQGKLELLWGDGPGQHVFQSHVLRDDGTRVALDPVQARRAAGDLYALMNRRVAVNVVAPARGLQRARIDAMVAVQPVRVAGSSAIPSYQAAAALPVSGNRRWVTVMCKFSDMAAEPKNAAFFEQQYADAPRLLGRYWKDVSYGKVDLSGSQAHGWFTLPHPRAYYTPEGKRTNLYQLFRDCVAAADAVIDFSQFYGVNTVYNGELDGMAWGGSGCAPFDGGPSVCKPGTFLPPWAYESLAPFAHEMGHGFGMPHSDNSDGDGDSYDNPWDNMSDDWSNATVDATFGTLPKHVNMYQRERMGWVDEARKLSLASTMQAPQVIDLDYASLAAAPNRQLVMVTLPETPDPAAQVAYTIEARRPMGDFEGELAGDAVIVHRLEGYGTARSQDGDATPATRSNNEGSMFKIGESFRLPGTSLRVSVVARTATGFRVRLSKGHFTGGAMQALRK